MSRVLNEFSGGGFEQSWGAPGFLFCGDGCYVFRGSSFLFVGF